MTRAELQNALQQQQAENAALRAELARAQQAALKPAPAVDGLPPAQEKMVQLMLELYPALMICTLDGYIVWVSPGFTELCGFELAQIAGQRASDIVRPNLVDPHQLAYIQAHVRDRLPFQFETENPQCGTDWIRVRVQPIFDDEHEPVLLAGMLEDITKWKNTQLTLNESERRFQTLAENVPGVLYQWCRLHDGGFRFDYVSPKMFELFGIRTEEITRMPEFIHPDDVPAFRQSMAVAVKNRASWSFEGRVVVAGQPLRWMRGNAGVTSVDERGVNYSGILQDVTPVRLAEMALRERDLRWRLAVEGFGDGAWEQNVQTNEVYFSADYKAMLGYADEEFPNEISSWHAHVHPDELENVFEALRVFLKSGATLGFTEYRMRCKDGSYKWILSRAVITARDSEGQPLIITGLHSEITELKQAREALEETSRRLSTVIANFHEGLVLEDENRHIMLTNEAFCRLVGSSAAPEAFVDGDGSRLATELADLVKNPAQYASRITALLRRRQPVTGDLLKLRDGRTVQRDYTPIYDYNRYIGQLWKFEDVTTRAREQEQLVRREEKYRGIIENMSLGLVEADLNDHLTYANQSFCNMTGFCVEELAGRPLSPLLLTGDDLALVESKLKTRQQGISDSYEIVITTKSGEDKWLLVTGAPLYNRFQQHIGSIGIYLDITPQKVLEASLREAKATAEVSTRAKEDFLANMSHEIRTPMNAILGMSQLLAKTELTEAQGSFLHAITASAENLLVIINDILDLSKIDAGHMAVEHIGFSPAQLLTQIEKTLLYKAEAKGLHFTTHLGPNVPPVLIGDPYRITQVLLNLAGNAVKFTEDGSVSVACSLVQRLPSGEVEVEFAVGDTGIGMDEGFLARVFDHFSQEDSSVTRKFGGTGLGLGISKKLVELLGGELRITSQKQWGTTSRFCLHLPVGTAQDQPCNAAGPDLSLLRQALLGKEVLLVEDNFFNRMLATVLLTNNDLRVTEAENGEEAVALVKNRSFDLILMDVQMPMMDGYEATAIVRQELGITTPIIALTANATSGEREKCLAVGMSDYLAKPFQEAALIQMVYDWTTAAPPEPAAGSRKNASAARS